MLMEVKAKSCKIKAVKQGLRVLINCMIRLFYLFIHYLFIV